MRPAPVDTLLRLLLLAGGASFVNPIEEKIDLSPAWVEIPDALVALGGDVRVRVGGAPPGGAVKVRLAREEDEGRALLATMPLALDADDRLTLPCGYFSRGGVHYLELVADLTDNFLDYEDDNSTRKVKRDVSEGSIVETADSVVKSWKFDVRWPSASLAVTPEQIQTYPERQVTAILEFPNVECAPLESSADFWLELLYCGHSSGGAVLCDGRNSSTHAHVLYSEQMHGFPGRRTMTLRCELFGQAGDYALTLRPAAAAPPQDLATAFIKADWSEQFVLNVHGGSVFPCGEGVRALFQYPECALEGADRVRLFGRDADRLSYVAERRVKRGQHTASFDCRLFSERFPEYCFVYVSQAVTGAVADVRMDCLPTLPLTEGGAGGWGEWSAWSACPAPAHCSTRTRSRHRFCDNPPPAYGAKYCEGQAVELAGCECAARGWAGDAAGVVAEVGPRCRCGCVLHLAPAARLLAGSARACPARSFWLLQAEEGLVVRLRLESVRLPCAGQALRARDGDSLAAPLLASWEGPHATPHLTTEADSTTESGGVVEVSGGRHILVELRTADTSERCAGGFLAHAMQHEPYRNASAAWASVSGGGVAAWWGRGAGARGAALALAAAAALAALLLAAHSAHRTRTYRRANDKDSLTDSDACSASLQLVGGGGSRSTLVSEVAGGGGGARRAGLALRRLLPAATHTRLRDSCTSTCLDNRDGEEQASDSEADENESASEADDITSVASSATVTPESASSAPAGAGAGGGAGAGSGVGAGGATLRRSRTEADTHVISEQIASSSIHSNAETVTVDLSASECERDDNSEKDRNSALEKDRSGSRASSSVSASTLTNGWYSPALSGVSSARVRSKESKEVCNRRLLTSHAASRASLASHSTEMELDYYDYEVNNAGSVPGSYLGMDPAFLVWIPPLEEGDILREIDENGPIYEEIIPKELHPDPGSNTESPEERPSSSRLRRHNVHNRPNQPNPPNDSSKSIRHVIDRGNLIHPLNFSISDLQNSPDPSRKNKRKKDEIPVTIQMHDLTLTRSPVRVHKRADTDNCATLKRLNDNTRETTHEALSALTPTTDFSDIKFADETSESSNDIKFADDSPDSNKLLDKYDLQA